MSTVLKGIVPCLLPFVFILIFFWLFQVEGACYPTLAESRSPLAIKIKLH